MDISVQNGQHRARLGRCCISGDCLPNTQTSHFRPVFGTIRHYSAPYNAECCRFAGSITPIQIYTSQNFKRRITRQLYPPQTASTMGSISSKFPKRPQSSQFDVSSLSTLPARRFEWIDGGDYKPDAVSVYSTPRGEDEEWRFNAQHQVLRFVFEGNYMTPIEEDLRRGIRVLDAGCGTGIWSIEMAREYPNSEFVGTDLVDVLKGSLAKEIPSNCRFFFGNTLRLPFKDNCFDYAFQRLQSRSFREVEWPMAVSELVRVTKPGGWVELVDMDGWLYGGPCITALYAKIRMIYMSRGINTEFVHRLPEFLQAEGLLDIEQSHRAVPMGWGPEEIATLSAKNAEVGLRGFKPVVVKETSMGEQEYDVLVDNALTEFELYKACWYMHYAYGRKPITTNCEEH